VFASTGLARALQYVSFDALSNIAIRSFFSQLLLLRGSQKKFKFVLQAFIELVGLLTLSDFESLLYLIVTALISSTPSLKISMKAVASILVRSLARAKSNTDPGKFLTT